MVSMPTIVAIRRYPLKSARGEVLEETEIEPTGLRGDRTWACVDSLDGTIASAKHPKRWGRLLDVGATLSDDGAEQTLAVHIGGTTLNAGTAAADAALTSHLGRPVRLTRDVPPEAALHRTLPDDAGMVPEWMDDVGPGQDAVTTIAGAQRIGRFADFGAVHIVTTGALSLLGDRMGTAKVAAARFRPNLVIDMPCDPEPGQDLRVGDVALRVGLPTPRCVIPGLSQAGLPADRAVLSTLARHHRILVPGLGRAACFGVYAEVIRPGRLRLGQPVR